MKTLINLLLLVFIGGFSSCELLSNNDPKTELEKLPPITQEGKNTFGCLVNGKAFVVGNASLLTAIFQQGQLQFGATLNEGNREESLSISLVDPLTVSEIYNFDGAPYYSGYTLKKESSICIYRFVDTVEGFVVFSNIDRVNFIISGAFEFSTVTGECDTVKITDGRFDMRYIP
ncbi:MAG: hypothetical protein DYG99_06465 [Bacteroidetes bacterium CHB5]|nr:hypothetical protein [Bacteroidetes bacterium CHB5]